MPNGIEDLMNATAASFDLRGWKSSQITGAWWRTCRENRTDQFRSAPSPSISWSPTRYDVGLPRRLPPLSKTPRRSPRPQLRSQPRPHEEDGDRGAPPDRSPPGNRPRVRRVTANVSSSLIQASRRAGASLSSSPPFPPRDYRDSLSARRPLANIMLRRGVSTLFL